MTRILIRYAARACAGTIALAFIVALVLLTFAEAIGLLICGVVVAADFLALIHLGGRLLSTREPKNPVGLVLLLFAKLAALALILGMLVLVFKVSAFAVIGGIGAAILGFVWGATWGARSAEGQRQMDAEELAIAHDQKEPQDSRRDMSEDG